MKKYTSTSERETIKVGEEIGKNLKGDEIVILRGELGSGKTYIVKGICKAFGIEEKSVNSPSFTIMNIYEGEGIKIFHLDLYRLGKDEGEEILTDIEGEGLILVEWGEKISKNNFKSRIVEIEIKTHLNGERIVTLN